MTAEYVADINPEKDDDDDEEEERPSRYGRTGLRLVESKSEREEDRSKPEPKSRQEKDPIELFKTPASEVKTASKEDVPEEDEVSESEKPLAIRALAAEEAKAIAGSEAVPDLVAKDMLEEAAETGDLEAAAEHAAAAIGATVEELQAAEQTIEAEAVGLAEQAEPETATAKEAESETYEPQNSETTEEVMFDRAAKQPDESGESEDEAVAAGSSGGSGTPPKSPPVGGGSGQPPHEPMPPFGGGLPPRGSGPIPTMSGNLHNTPITPDSPAVERYDQGNPAVTALIGGIIGYYIGRRRGRIKAEKRLLPIQKKLEKQVEDLHWQVKRKEMAVRRLAQEKLQQNGPYIIEAVAARRAARPEQAKRPKQAERQNIERRPAPEASQLHGSNKAHERLGHMLVTAEASGQQARQTVETAPKKAESNRQEQIPEYLRQRHVETLNRAELLSLSEKIIVDGTSLRQIYETHLIGERGLRRLVAEYLRGGEVKKILRREIVEHEIDFERDPAMRDLPAQATGITASTAPSKTTLNQLVEQASAGLGGDGAEALAYYKARAAYEAQENEEQSNQRRLVDISLTAIISVLVIIIIVLFLSGR